jgi:hypothetical protein
MTPMKNMKSALLLALAIGAAPVAFAEAALAPAAPKRPQLEALVPATHIGPYETWAKIILETYKKGDVRSAATQAALLGDFFTASENHFKTESLPKWDAIHQAMDNFIKPLMNHIEFGEPKPDVAKLEAALAAYIGSMQVWGRHYYR